MKYKAFDFDKRNVARTYLVADAELLSKNEIEVAGYFTLAIKSLLFDSSLSKNKIKEIDGFSKSAMLVGAVIIGQLGKNEKYTSKIRGTEIMNFALDIIGNVASEVGGRITFLECQDLPALVGFYEKNEFVRLKNNEQTGLLQMIRFL